MLGPGGEKVDTQLYIAYILMERIDQSQASGRISMSNHYKCNKEAIKQFHMENNGKEGGFGTNFS